MTFTENSSVVTNDTQGYQCERSGLEKAKKGLASTLITATTSVHLPKPVSTNLTINPDSVLTNPIGKDGVQSWSM